MIIVTGGAGFIGSAFVRELNDRGLDDIMIVDRLGEGDKWKNLVGLRYREFIHKDDFLGMLLEGEIQVDIETIVHLGACSATTETDADYLMDNNYHYTVDLMNWAVDRDIRFIYASSAATYGDGTEGFSDDDAIVPKLRPANMYGYSKQLADLYVLREELTDMVTGLKFFNVFGPNEYHKGTMSSVVFKAWGQIRETGKVNLFKSDHPGYRDGEQLRDFIYIKDVTRILYDLMQNREATGIFNLGTGVASTWIELVTPIFKALNKDLNIEFVDMPENLKGKYQYRTRADMAKLTAVLPGLAFMSLSDAVTDYVSGYLEKDCKRL